MPSAVNRVNSMDRERLVGTRASFLMTMVSESSMARVYENATMAIEYMNSTAIGCAEWMPRDWGDSMAAITSGTTSSAVLKLCALAHGEDRQHEKSTVICNRNIEVSKREYRQSSSSPVLLLAGRPPAKHFTINITSETIKQSWGMNPLKNLCHDAKKLKVREDGASKDV